MKRDLALLRKKLVDSYRESREVPALREHLTAVLGPNVWIEGTLEELASAVNDRVDYLNATGMRRVVEGADYNRIRKFANHASPTVRSMVARFAPQRLLGFFLNDKDYSVRAVAARRATTDQLKEAVKNNPYDKHLKIVMKEAIEAEKLSKFTNTVDEVKLDDSWYRQKAHDLIKFYGRDVENRWVSASIKQVVLGARGAAGLTIDEEKLRDTVREMLEDQDDYTIEHDVLRETVQKLNGDVTLEEVSIPIIDDEPDVVQKLMSVRSSTMFVERFEKEFNVGPTSSRPSYCTLPRGIVLERVERALDKYVNDKNRVQDVYHVDWTYDNNDPCKVIFRRKLRERF